MRKELEELSGYCGSIVEAVQSVLSLVRVMILGSRATPPPWSSLTVEASLLGVPTVAVSSSARASSNSSKPKRRAPSSPISAALAVWLGPEVGLSWPPQFSSGADIFELILVGW